MKIKTRDLILVAFFAAMMAVGAKIEIPFPFIALTFQPFFCAFAGILLGSKLGALSQLVYAAVGLAGAPIFSTGGGISYVLQPSFGFIIGFIAGAFVIGKISEKLKDMNLRNALISVMSGLLTINLIGVPYLFAILKFYKSLPGFDFMSALKLGFYPFIIKDFALYVMVALTASRIIPILTRARLIDRK